jgi:hypothetical protein
MRKSSCPIEAQAKYGVDMRVIPIPHRSKLPQLNIEHKTYVSLAQSSFTSSNREHVLPEQCQRTSKKKE